MRYYYSLILSWFEIYPREKNSNEEISNKNADEEISNEEKREEKTKKEEEYRNKKKQEMVLFDVPDYINACAVIFRGGFPFEADFNSPVAERAMRVLKNRSIIPADILNDIWQSNFDDDYHKYPR
jgi:hypothetical protein